MNKKIGILTFQNAVNYGGVLQATALHRFLVSIGFENEIINYQNELFNKQYSPVQKSGNMAKDIVRLILVTPKQKRKNAAFENFLESNTQISKRLSREQMDSISSRYNCIISGSDQVFNLELTKNDTTYLLDFCQPDTIKASYAASFGQTDNIEKHKDIFYKNLSQFKSISLREEQACNFVSSMNLSSIRHIDPTLLLSADEWNDLLVLPKEKNYILLYTLGRGEYVDQTIKAAKDLSEKTGYPIIYINDALIGRKKGLKYKSFLSPGEFVGYFKSAKYVVTNSFHGTAFSVIFNKSFFVNTNIPYGKGVRIEDLLSLIDIKNRDIDNRSFSEQINWGSVNDVVNSERLRTKEYFCGLLGCVT